MPLIADPEYFAETIHRLADWAKPREPALVFGAEARGFIFGAALAYAIGAGFIAARKPEAPRETVEATYALEYGTDSLHVHRDAVPAGARVIVLDDVLATGGTAHAKVRLGSSWGASWRASCSSSSSTSSAAATNSRATTFTP